MLRYVVAITLFTTMALAQPPQPQLPLTYIDTTFSPPTGTIRHAHTSFEFQDALSQSNPGDTIVLDAGATYTGNFKLPAKTNPNRQWIYIESSALSSLPPPGTRVDPATDAGLMPKIVTPNSSAALIATPGANHYRIVGLELFSTSNVGCRPTHVPPINCFSYQLVTLNWKNGRLMPDSITVDRSYLHGSATQDVGQAILANASNFAVVDSYISDIHESTFDSQAVLAFRTPGPIKIVDNFLSATTEEVMFGGAGGTSNTLVPSDIEIRSNHFFKPLLWEAVGVTIPPHAKWSEKNNLEFKSARRVLVDSNVLENTWLAAQTGHSILLTVRTGQSGNNAVVDDITLTNNILKNVAQGVVTSTSDYNCAKTPHCTNPGETRRIKFYNNLILFKDPVSRGGTPNFGFTISPGLRDLLIQHNTFVPASGAACHFSVYWEVANGSPWPPPEAVTHNNWVLDNVLCRQATGDHGNLGIKGLTYYMGDPSPLSPRFLGNVMYVAKGDQTASYPPENDLSTASFTYVNPSAGNYQLSVPDWTSTSDGTTAGVSNSALPTQ